MKERLRKRGEHNLEVVWRADYYQSSMLFAVSKLKEIILQVIQNGKATGGVTNENMVAFNEIIYYTPFEWLDYQFLRESLFFQSAEKVSNGYEYHFIADMFIANWGATAVLVGETARWFLDTEVFKAAKPTVSSLARWSKSIEQSPLNNVYHFFGGQGTEEKFGGAYKTNFNFSVVQSENNRYEIIDANIIDFHEKFVYPKEIKLCTAYLNSFFFEEFGVKIDTSAVREIFDDLNYRISLLNKKFFEEFLNEFIFLVKTTKIT